MNFEFEFFCINPYVAQNRKGANLQKVNWLVSFVLLSCLLACNQNSLAPTAATFHPQFVFNSRGELLLVWCEESGSGANLLVAAVDDKHQIGNPTRVNQIPELVNASSFDELRPSIAVGAQGLLAIGFTDNNWDVQVALSRDDGKTFEPSIKLNQDTTRAMQSFVAAAFDAAGGLHCVWLDPREAPVGQEEPCDLYYALIRDGHVIEKNLTAEQVQSVCGCCRPDLVFRNDGILEVVFRNTDGSGSRDIFKITKSAADGFSLPVRIGPQLWKIAGCPAAGPIVIKDWTLWNDGSTGTIRLLALEKGKVIPEPLLTSSENWTLNGSPRPVKTNDSALAFILIPGAPTAKLLQLDNSTWHTVSEEVPEWCRHAAFANGQLLLVGSMDGELKMESRPFDFF